MSEKTDKTEQDRPEFAQWSAWMAAAQDGDGVAYQNLLQAVLPLIRAIVSKKIQDPDKTEDIVQEVLMSVHKNRHTYDPSLPFKPWLATITQRRTIDALRKIYRQGARETLVDEYPETFLADETNISPEDDLVFAMGDELSRALESLPAGQRTAVELLKLREMSLKEASEASGMSVAALKVAMHRALKSLRTQMAPKPEL
ncbi:sigma-70 family RNA polymerase sigma factor [Magnetovibrio sp. PR-2]|uniref:sigma-70 family RNA polymerase sigma factor n=1 Tax=Magnetovibrio sp. PR-2 TaxID=3120356 RepID=UPI002FCE09A7